MTMQNHSVTEEALFEEVLQRLSPAAIDFVLRARVRNLPQFLDMCEQDLFSECPEVAEEISKTGEHARQVLQGKYTIDDTTLVDIPSKVDSNEANASLPIIAPAVSVAAVDTTSVHRTSVARTQLLHSSLGDLWKILQGHGVQGRKELLSVCRQQMREWGLTLRQIDRVIATQNKLRALKPISFGIKRRLTTPHWKAVPPEQLERYSQKSLLSKTLVDLFARDSRHFSEVASALDTVTLRQLLSLGDEDWQILSAVPLFPEDLADELLFISMGILLANGINTKILDAVLKAGMRLFGTQLSQELLETLPQNSLIPEAAMLPDMRLEVFQMDSVSVEEIDHLGLKRLGDIVELSEFSICRMFGLGVKSIALIATFSNLRTAILRWRQHTKDLPVSCFNSFEDFNRAWLDRHIPAPRYAEAVGYRLGLFESDKKYSLEVVGQKLGVTRERARQILKKQIVDLQKSGAFRQLAWLWQITEAHLLEVGGIDSLNNIAEVVASTMGWSISPMESALHSLLELDSRFILDWQKRSVQLVDCLCLQCTTCSERLDNIFTEEIGVLHESEVSHNLIEACKQDCPAKINGSVSAFSSSFIQAIALRTKDVIYTNGCLHKRNAFSGRYGSRIQQVEAVLAASNKPLHFKEVYLILKQQDGPNAPSVGGVNNNLAAAHNALLWGRGIFIHRSRVKYPTDLLAHIEEWLESILKEGSSVVSVYGVYTHFEKDLNYHGIPNNYALYTALRETCKALTFPRYPTIQPKDTTERIPFAVALEEFIQEEGGFVRNDVILNHGVDKLLLAPYMLPMHLQWAPNIHACGRAGRIHRSNIPPATRALTPIVQYALSILSQDGPFNVSRLFKERRIDCHEANITSPEILFAWLKEHASSQLHLSSYPEVGLSDEGLERRSRGVTAEIVAYLASRPGPVSLDEVNETFVRKRQHSDRIVYNILHKDDVLRYSRGSLIHINALEWSSEKQQHLELAAKALLEEEESAGQLYARLDILREIIDRPLIPNHIALTTTLLGELLVFTGKFATLGSARNAFVTVKDDHTTTFEDIVAAILRERFEGAAKLEEFEEYLRHQRLIAKKLTLYMLGDQTRVILEGGIVYTRGGN